jgi:SAM-dependent methyltransferase
VRRLRPSVSAFWQSLGVQLRHPSGLAGRMAGSFMGLANAKPNRASLAALGLSDGENLLELGCGPGHALQVLLRDPHLERAIGLDWSETMLAQAARRNRRSLETGRLALVRGDFASLPFDDGSADAVLAVNVVYFMSATAVGEARRVLRGGGRLVIYATHGSAMRRWPFAGRHSHRLFDCKRLAALLAEAGFARDRIRVDDVNAGFGVSGLLAVATKDDTTAGQPECCAEEDDDIDDDGRSRCCCAQPSSARNASSAKYLIP